MRREITCNSIEAHSNISWKHTTIYTTTEGKMGGWHSTTSKMENGQVQNFSVVHIHFPSLAGGIIGTLIAISLVFVVYVLYRYCKRRQQRAQAALVLPLCQPPPEYGQNPKTATRPNAPPSIQEQNRDPMSKPLGGWN